MAEAGAERGVGAPRATAMGGPAGRSPPDLGRLADPLRRLIYFDANVSSVCREVIVGRERSMFEASTRASESWLAASAKWYRHGEGNEPPLAAAGALKPDPYFRCFPTSFVISNMFTCDLPPNTSFSAASALIIRLFFESCRPFFLM